MSKVLVFAALAGIGKTHVRIGTKGHRLLFSGEVIGEAPEMRTGRLDKEKKAAAAAQFLRLGRGA